MAEGKGSRNKIEFVVIFKSAIDKSYNAWKRIKDKRKTQDNDKIEDYLVRQGFIAIPVEHKDAYRIRRDVFDKLDRGNTSTQSNECESEEVFDPTADQIRDFDEFKI
jgi:hypothetical protein